MVTISRVYTRTGDAGRTRLSNLSETDKTDPRVEAYGDVDEANSHLGVALAYGLEPELQEVLEHLQNELFDLGADLSTPLVEHPAHEPLRIVADSVQRLEGWCDEFSEDLPVLRSFVLPGGTPAAAALHVARTVTRRAERRAWAAVAVYGTDPAPADGSAPGGLNPLALTYLNRLSDLLFVLARRLAVPDGETLWVPGSGRGRRPEAADSGTDVAG
ncbi:cob(I)yrinic acid a,c-diamide adenosyltransferase [Desertihabitans brevis]|uniref:Corrinoid adenosyltransferase n=1 Tax=Desertihabitans brevis TaxID=2268447 RepID=A0A367YYS5_9ACTN|nr:cob(I)yrinic acid a,c-diamide adenosyltransferase [Desertihabitans brevis]RCK71046.1 cob(I)yrinic acid a,c-diamide adenosyltransferase [Desertihabitans brevis]